MQISGNLRMLHVDANPIRIYLQSYEQFSNAEKIYNKMDLNAFFANISKTISATSNPFPWSCH